jgi:outer membrane lipoprotein-sorting protein
MRPADNTHKLFKKLRLKASAKLDDRVHSDIARALEKPTKTKPAPSQPNVWGIIMKSKTMKLAAAAVIIIGVLIAMNMLRATPISGTTVYYDSNNIPEYKPFECWIKLNDKKGDLLMRFESPREIGVVQGDKVYRHRPSSNKVTILEGQTIHNLKFWYKVMELSPWLSGEMLHTLKPLADDWQQEYGKYEKTGRDCVFVNCSYKQLSASFSFVFDVESKLIVEAKHWSDPNRKDPVNLYADNFVYNEEIPDETFNFKIPDGAKVIYQKDIERRQELMKKGWELFEAGQYADALRIYQEADSLFMTGTYPLPIFILATPICRLVKKKKRLRHLKIACGLEKGFEIPKDSL